MKKLALTIATLSLAGAAAAVTAQEPVFRWTPEELTTLERIAATHDRIKHTAAEYCQDHLNGTRALSAWRSCVKAVSEEIVMNIDDARMTAYATTGTVDEALLASVPAKERSS